MTSPAYIFFVFDIIFLLPGFQKYCYETQFTIKKAVRGIFKKKVFKKTFK